MSKTAVVIAYLIAIGNLAIMFPLVWWNGGDTDAPMVMGMLWLIYANLLEARA